MDELNQRLSTLEANITAWNNNTQRSDIEYRKQVKEKIDFETERINQLIKSLEEAKKQLNQSLGYLTEQSSAHETWLNLLDKAVKGIRERLNVLESLKKPIPPITEVKKSFLDWW